MKYNPVVSTRLIFCKQNVEYTELEKVAGDKCTKHTSRVTIRLFAYLSAGMSLKLLSVESGNVQCEITLSDVRSPWRKRLVRPWLGASCTPVATPVYTLEEHFDALAPHCQIVCVHSLVDTAMFEIHRF